MNLSNLSDNCCNSSDNCCNCSNCSSKLSILPLPPRGGEGENCNITPSENANVYKMFSKLGKDIWFVIFKKIGMRNTKNLYISCKWLHDYITHQEYFDYLITHKLMKLFHMFRNNLTFGCGKNDEGKNNQMCTYVVAKNIETDFAKYVRDKTYYVKSDLHVTPDFIYCERCEVYHDPIIFNIVPKITTQLCIKCNLITCKWNIENKANMDEFYKISETLYKKSRQSKVEVNNGHCDDCLDLVKCSCGEIILNSFSLFCASNECYKQNCNVWKCHKCVLDFFTQCKCCSLYCCSHCIKEIDFSFMKVEKGILTPIGSKVCNYCIENKIKSCGKCSKAGLTNLLWKCSNCSTYFHKQCFDVRTKCSLCQKGQKMPKEHTRKCGENVCEMCYNLQIGKQICSVCNSSFEPVDCLICKRNLVGHNQNECLKKRSTECSVCAMDL